MNSRTFEEVQRGEGINKDNNPEKIGGVQSEWSWHAFSPSPCVEFRGAVQRHALAPASNNSDFA